MNRIFFYLVAGIQAVFILIAGKWATGQAENEPVLLRVIKAGSAPVEFSMRSLASYRKIELSEKDHDGKEHKFEGVALSDLLKAAGVTMGDALRGPNMAQYVLAKSRDGYQVVYALPELDSGFSTKTVLLAFHADGEALPAEKGPLQIIVPGEKKHARWIWGVDSVLVKTAKE
jgi:DMSO/TMAO reductase YedYZ molybdopterin-dependent catalytic subunit